MAKPKKSRAGKMHKRIVPCIPVMVFAAQSQDYIGLTDTLLAPRIILAIERLIARPDTPACDNVTLLLSQIRIGLHFTYEPVGLDKCPADIDAVLSAALDVMTTVAARTTHAEPVFITDEEANVLKACIPTLGRALYLIPVFQWERADVRVKHNAKLARCWIVEQVMEAA